ncbi:hypothetical protein [Prevotella sp. 10(H)]|uniref:hypothetical protein n=1 Tax=Prevotella sp. 10(H) TaxID=1158294 RepID=UPI0004A6FFD7|nr:hypothetical protein [Prevotella sp. 10(H)]
MGKLGRFCFWIPLKVFLLIPFISIITFLIFDSCIEKENEMYDSFDASQFFLFLSVLIAIVSAVMSFIAYLNQNKYVQKNSILSALTFYIPIIPSFILVLPYSAKFISVLLFSAIPVSLIILQTYHFIRFRKLLKTAKFEDYEND